MRVWIWVVIDCTGSKIEKIGLGNVLEENGYRKEGEKLRNEETSVQWKSISNDDITKNRHRMYYLPSLNEKQNQNQYQFEREKFHVEFEVIVLSPNIVYA